MRITSSMYYESLYGSNNSKLSERLFDVNKQIASGLKIQYAKDDVRTFAETMRLDNELAELDLVNKSTQSGYKISNQTDIILNEFSTTMDRTRTLLVSAANGTHSDASLDAIADELRVLEDHFKNLANTSINGQYLFSGTAVDIKPISSDGTYNGNNKSMNSFLGSRTQQQYNISGAELFFGEEVLVKREITSNVVQSNLNKKYDFVTGADNGSMPTPINTNDTIRDLMGDTDATSDTLLKHHFYLRGTSSDGTAFKKQISMKDDDSIDDLLTKIGIEYGNTGNLKLVNVSLNDFGEIVVEDKIKGSSKLDFHMVGAVDFANGGGAGDSANVTDIDLLDSGETDFAEIMNPTPPAVANNLFVKEFVVSGLTSASAGASNIEGIVYDRTNFSKNGSKLSSSSPQILKVDNSFAISSTKLSEVADITKGTQDAIDDTLAGTQFTMSGDNIYGNVYGVTIDLDKSALNGGVGSTFTISGNTYDIFNMSNPRAEVDADEITYQQLMDVMNMVMTNNLPSPAGTHNNEDGTPMTDAQEYDYAIEISNFNGSTFLSYDGKIQFQDLNSADTKASIALYDSNSDSFALTIDSDGDTVADKAAASVMTFNSNNALTIKDPKTDFFKDLNEMITAVENHKNYPDHADGDIRNIGIENSITKIDSLQDHILRTHSKVGAQSNALTASLERTQLLEISTMTLRSQTIDTDLAEASLKLTQLSLNYEAMLSTVGRISKLNLVNYL